MGYREDYKERLLNHIRLVNKYASKLGLSYPYHDNGKLDLLFEPYALWSKPNKTDEEQSILDQATLIHIKNTPHHPEYWTDTDLTGFTRRNYAPNGIIDASDMPEEYIIEFCCDCSATGEEMGNLASDWLQQRIGTRWYFTPDQQDLIFGTLSILENE